MSEPITVLLVDDHALVRQGVRAFLETQGDITVVAEAGDGEEAVRCAAEYAPDVALMDLIMPGMDGVEATRRLVARSPRTNVVMLTSYHDDEHVFPAIRAGALSYVLKEIGPDELADAVRKAAAGEAVLHPRVAARVVRELHGARRDAPNVFHELSDREMEVLKLIADGMHQRRDRRTRLYLSEKTVKEPRLEHSRQTSPRRPNPGRRVRLARGRRSPGLRAVRISVRCRTVDLDRRTKYDRERNYKHRQRATRLAAG